MNLFAWYSLWRFFQLLQNYQLLLGQAKTTYFCTASSDLIQVFIGVSGEFLVVGKFADFWPVSSSFDALLVWQAQKVVNVLLQAIPLLLWHAAADWKVLVSLLLMRIIAVHLGLHRFLFGFLGQFFRRGLLGLPLLMHHLKLPQKRASAGRHIARCL